MVMLKRCVAVLVVLASAGLIPACGEAEDELTATIDCAQVCNDWNDCHDDAMGVDVDVTACTDSCEDAADADEAWEAAIDDCEECLDGTEDCGSCWATCPNFPVPAD
jgi:hypothetical protein